MGGVFHLLNNSILKVLSFVIIGSVIKYSNSKPVNMPVTGACFILASLGVAGIPPLNGFAPPGKSRLKLIEPGE